jgi:hypothetical protein
MITQVNWSSSFPMPEASASMKGSWLSSISAVLKPQPPCQRLFRLPCSVSDEIRSREKTSRFPLAKL